MSVSQELGNISRQKERKNRQYIYQGGDRLLALKIKVIQDYLK